MSYDEERDCKVCDSGHRVDCFGNTDGPWGYVVYESLDLSTTLEMTKEKEASDEISGASFVWCDNLTKKRANLTILSLSVGITALYYPSKFFFTIGLLYAWKSIWSPKGSCESWQAPRYLKPHLGKQHTTPRSRPLDLWSLATIGTQECRSFRTQIRIPFCLYICLSKGHGEFSEMRFPVFNYNNL